MPFLLILQKQCTNSFGFFTFNYVHIGWFSVDFHRPWLEQSVSKWSRTDRFRGIGLNLIPSDYYNPLPHTEIVPIDIAIERFLRPDVQPKHTTLI